MRRTPAGLAEFIPAGFLLTGFAIMMLATAIAMIRGRRNAEGKPVPTSCQCSG